MQIINSFLTPPAKPIPHRALNSLDMPSLVLTNTLRRTGNQVLSETTLAVTAIRGSNLSGAVTALLDTDITMSAMVVAGIELELGPCGWDLCASLDAAFEGRGEAHPLGGVGLDSYVLEGVRKVGPGGAVAVPEVVVEVEVLRMLGVVGEVDTGA